MFATLLPTATPSLLTISVAGRAGHVFEPQTMLQGFACHARGVEITKSTHTHVHARVRSKRMHEVDLRAERGRLIAGCSCPARTMGCRVCKHVWAALLEADRHGGLEDLRTARGALDVIPAPLSEGGKTESVVVLASQMNGDAAQPPKKRDKKEKVAKKIEKPSDAASATKAAKPLEAARSKKEKPSAIREKKGERSDKASDPTKTTAKKKARR